MNNPFYNRGPIREPRFYFGRPRETREVVRLLAGTQNCSIVGPVKSGKTSLLLHLARPNTLGQGLSPAQNIATYLSFEGLGRLSAEQFFHHMMQELARQSVGKEQCSKITLLWPRIAPRQGLSFLELREVLDQIEVAGERLIFLLDEVELAAKNPAFDLNFFSALRHIGSRPGVCFVTATERRLDEMEIAGREVGSPFADLFSVVRLRPLEPEAAWKQVSGLAEEAEFDLSAERELILELAGGWPYYLQVVAYEVCERKAEGLRQQATEATGEEGLSEGERWYVRTRAFEQLEPVFSVLWERLGEGNREAALAALDKERGSEERDSEERGSEVRGVPEGQCPEGQCPEVEGLTVAIAGAGERGSKERGSGAAPAGALARHFLEERRRDRRLRLEDYLPAEEPAQPGAAARSAAPGSGAMGPDPQAMYAVVRALMRAVEARDRYARGHADRVARLAVAIAGEMGCSEEVARGIRVAARLHDIGRVSISDMILLKPGPLTALETEIIRTHPLVGAQILDALEFPWSVKPAVRYHHERLDGSGYPEGLMGEEIPLSARVVGVADVMAAMTADRPYRGARSEAEALAELTAHAGEKYDREVVGALERAVQRGAQLRGAG